VPDVCLGKKLGRVEDPRSLSVSMIQREVVVAPERHTVALHAEIPMFANDRFGDCTFAAMGHRISAQERSVAQSARPTVTVMDVLKGYSDVTGFNPEDPSTDNGAYLLDVLRYSRNVGIGREKDGSPHTIYAYARIDDPTNHAAVKRALWMFGGLYIGAGLPLSAADQIDEGLDWDVTGDPFRDRWGSWGGHAMYAQGYGPDRVRLPTWGQTQFATWDWWDAYVDEAWAIVNEDFLRTRTQLTPQGFDRGALESYLRDLG